MLEKIKEKIHIIFVIVMIIYLSALAIMTGYTFWDEQQRQKTSAQTADQQAGN